ncbi:hypothetical protein AB0I72_07880 [Nocardiopsis sp. NPDC049922]|uniref:hypothetical protein n=1 Tax=Nocardiopsis sp. NPDC049922 TaxID=3155157 RepID=UPI00341111F0
MSYEEKGTWAFLVASVAVYLAYVATVLSRAVDPITETPYQFPLLWSIAACVAVAVVLRVLIEIVRPSETHRIDPRDREIAQLGVLRSWGFLIAAALAAMGLAMLEVAHFWIANLLYLGFVLQAVTGAVVGLVAYRRGF